MILRQLLAGGPSLVPLAQIKAMAAGNSWVANFYATEPARGFVQLIGSALGITVVNTGVGSRKLTNDFTNPAARTPGNNMMYWGPIDIDPLLDPSKLNVLFTLEDINSAVDSVATPALMRAAWVEYRNQRKAAASAVGARLHICHLLAAPASIGIDPDYTSQASINALNAKMRGCNALVSADPAPVCDSTVNLAAIPQFSLPDFTNASFDSSGVYFTDRVHPNNAGHALIADAVVAVNATWRRYPN